MGCSKRSSKRKVYSITSLPDEIKKKNSNKKLNFTPNRTRKWRTKHEFSKRKEIIMIRAEINETEI